MHDDTTYRDRQRIDRGRTSHPHAETWDAFYDRHGDGAPLWSTTSPPTS